MNLQVRQLGRTDYAMVWNDMKSHVDSRDKFTLDELWLTEHNPVFTLGQAASNQHLLAPGDIPVIQTDRGGQVTYHGPGQLVGYLLRDLRRTKEGVHAFVRNLEQSMLDTLAAWDIDASRIQGIPGVYVDGRKIGSLGVRIRRGCSYHGIALNVKMDTRPFERINPCGLEGMRVAQMSDYSPDIDFQSVVEKFIECTASVFGYDSTHCTKGMSDFSVA